MSGYEVEKGVPLTKAATTTKYPWAEMEPGDSFFVEGGGDRRSVVSSVASARGRRTGEKYTIRKVDGGFRVWRVE